MNGIRCCKCNQRYDMDVWDGCPLCGGADKIRKDMAGTIIAYYT
jgi:hypothetical protein